MAAQVGRVTGSESRPSPSQTGCPPHPNPLPGRAECILGGACPGPGQRPVCLLQPFCSGSYFKCQPLREAPACPPSTEPSGTASPPR